MSLLTYSIPTHSYQIHDRPIEELPLFRLQKEGAEVLSANELLQIALGRVDGFTEILQEYGIQFLTTLQNVPDIIDTLHLDHIQASRLLAILALGKRLYAPAAGSMPLIRGIEDVYNYCRSMSSLAKEQLRVLLINSRYYLVHEETVSIGGIETLSITPRDVFQSAVERRVAALILVHNHPSGDPAPSQADYDITQVLKEAGKLLGIEVLDHVIIGSHTYSSCLQNQAVS